MTGEPDTSRVLPLVKAVGTPYAGNPHVRCEEGVGVTSPLLYRLCGSKLSGLPG